MAQTGRRQLGEEIGTEKAAMRWGRPRYIGEVGTGKKRQTKDEGNGKR